MIISTKLQLCRISFPDLKTCGLGMRMSYMWMHLQGVGTRSSIPDSSKGRQPETRSTGNARYTKKKKIESCMGVGTGSTLTFGCPQSANVINVFRLSQ